MIVRFVHKSQSGAVLLMLLLILVVTMSTVSLSLFVPKNPDLNKKRLTQEALKEAKSGLIAYIAAQYESAFEYMQLPCPDISTVGFSEGSKDPQPICGDNTVNVLGRFPWRSLELPPIKDGNGECLWYVVSGNYKHSNTGSMKNEDTNGFLKLFSSQNLVTPTHGVQPEDRVVALLISPGMALAGQNRSDALGGHGVLGCSGNYNAANYLDAIGGIDNRNVSPAGNSTDDFVSFDLDDANGNDVILPITRNEVFGIVRKRTDFYTQMDTLTKSVAECIRDFRVRNSGAGDARLPYPAAVDFADDDYDNLANYDDDPGAPPLMPGRIPVMLDDSRVAIPNGGAGAENLLTSCGNALSVPDSELDKLWKHWKDHLFYAVAPARHPGQAAGLPCGLGVCLTVNNLPTLYSAVVIFSGTAVAQVRNQAPDPLDTKGDIANYLEGFNATPVPGSTNFDSGAHPPPALPPSPPFYLPEGTDVVYCISDDGLAVVACG